MNLIHITPGIFKKNYIGSKINQTRVTDRFVDDLKNFNFYHLKRNLGGTKSFN
jgi:hypothetical protein